MVIICSPAQLVEGGTKNNTSGIELDCDGFSPVQLQDLNKIGLKTLIAQLNWSKNENYLFNRTFSSRWHQK